VAFDFNDEPIRLFGIMPQTPFPLEVSIYSLCSLSCAFCFSNLNRFAHDRELHLENSTPKLFQRIDRALQDPKDPVGFFLREKMCLVFSNSTDPFQRQEKQYRASEAFLAWAKAENQPLWVQTKGNTLHEEFDRYAPLLLPGKDVVYLSITHADDATRKKIEPGALSISKRWELAQMLSSRGIPVVAACNPYVKEWVPDIDAYCDQALAAGCRGIWIDRLHFSKSQSDQLHRFYEDLKSKANLAPAFYLPQVKHWYEACEDRGLDCFPTPYWDAFFGDRARFPECCDPAWVGGHLFDFAFQFLRLVSETSLLTDHQPVMFSWPDLEAFLVAIGVPNPTLTTAPFWKPYYCGMMKGDYKCWVNSLGKEAPLYQILRYYFNHPWECQNFLWYHPRIRALFDKDLYVADDEGDLIAVYDPSFTPAQPFTLERSQVSWDKTTWLDVKAFLTEYNEPDPMPTEGDSTDLSAEGDFELDLDEEA
jgi:DNA repair photolyase